MATMDEKATLKRYLDSLRTALLWKLDGLEEWQARWPVTATGTNILGVVKHLAAMEYGYLGLVFDRPGEALPFMGPDAEPNADLWATLDEPLEEIVRFYRRAVAHADATIDELDLDAIGHVPWWPEPEVSLYRVLVHLCVEVARHVGQVDVLRERLDGRIGLGPVNSNLPFADDAAWGEHVEQLRQVAIDAQWPGARQGLYGLPGPQRDALLALLLTGAKTATSSLLAEWRRGGEPLPSVGEREVLISSGGFPVGVIETTDVRVVRLDEVDLDHVLDEGAGFADTSSWRTAQLQLWSSPEVRAELDDPQFVPDESTLVVLQRIRLEEKF